MNRNTFFITLGAILLIILIYVVITTNKRVDQLQSASLFQQYRINALQQQNQHLNSQKQLLTEAVISLEEQKNRKQIGFEYPNKDSEA